MNANEIKLDIEKRISKIDETFTRKVGRSISKKSAGNDILSLELLLKNISGNLRTFHLVSIVLINFLWVLITFSWILSTIKYYAGIDIIDINKYGLFFNINTYAVFFIGGLPFILIALKHNQFKANLENKIYLLKLLDKIEIKENEKTTF